MQHYRETAAIAQVLAIAVALTECAPPNVPVAATPPASAVESSSRPSASGVITVIPTEADTRLLRVEDLLANRVPGLQVARRGDGTFSLRIRGQAGLRGGSGDAEPLLIIDGVMIAHGTQGPALASLAPRDVARIEVHKDIAATGPFGARGANGVLIVYTKRSNPR